jgi:PadR family transcriptional regulator PadR
MNSKRKRGIRAGRGRRIRRFLQASILLMLKSDEAHGYALLPELDRFGFDMHRLDPSVVYRLLRKMEVAGWVISRWSEDSLGPRRRVYAITEAGEQHLVDLVEDLRAMRAQIDHLLEMFDHQTE